jgi:hypothetical protein
VSIVVGCWIIAGWVVSVVVWNIAGWVFVSVSVVVVVVVGCKGWIIVVSVVGWVGVVRVFSGGMLMIGGDGGFELERRDFLGIFILERRDFLGCVSCKDCSCCRNS